MCLTEMFMAYKEKHDDRQRAEQRAESRVGGFSSPSDTQIQTSTSGGTGWKSRPSNVGIDPNDPAGLKALNENLNPYGSGRSPRSAVFPGGISQPPPRSPQQGSFGMVNPMALGATGREYGDSKNSNSKGTSSGGSAREDHPLASFPAPPTPTLAPYPGRADSLGTPPGSPPPNASYGEYGARSYATMQDQQRRQAQARGRDMGY